MMAVVFMEENEILNETLSGLRSTTKGQLTYNADWEFNEDDSDKFICTFESYFSHSPESLHLISNVSLIDLEDNKFRLKNVSLDLSKEVQYVDTIADKTASTLDRKTRDTPAKIAANFESKNELTIKEYNKETREIAEIKKEIRSKVFVRRAKNLKRDTSVSLEIMRKKLGEENQRFLSEMDKRRQKDCEEMKKMKEELDEQAKEHKRKLDEMLTKCLIEESHLAQEEEKRKEVMENLKKNITSLYHQVLYNFNIIQKKFKDFQYMSFVTGGDYQRITTDLSQIITKAEAVLKKSKAITDLSVAEDHLKDMDQLVEQTASIEKRVVIILKEAEDIATKKKEAMEAAKVKREELLKEQTAKAEMNTRQKIRVDEKAGERAVSFDKKLSNLENTIEEQGLETATRCISNEAFSQYAKLQEVLKTTQDSFKDFISDPKHTKYKFDLHKAVNVPINALSAHSPSHLNDKIHRLVSLLAGNNVHVGGKAINCNSHPSALAFCKNLVAKKLVMQGAQQVSSSPSSAFIYAAVIVGIWSAFPDVGQLILAHFHLSYPYLVPYYMPKQDGQSTDDYHKALGYSIVHDKVEDQDKFLKKFSGSVQLYAAVVTSSGASQTDHPHGIEQGWTWLARVLNLKPHASVTATMLYHFISVGGHVLMKQYGRQFQKLLLVLCKEFVPVIDKVTPSEKKGPTQRLKDFLEDCIKFKRIPVPEGYLTERWWHSGHF